MKNAFVLSCKCHNGKLFGVTIEEFPDHTWEPIWAFPITEKMAKVEGYNSTKFSGTWGSLDRYPGCPYCGRTGIVQCGACGKTMCYNSGEEDFDCKWCGKRIKKVEYNARFDYKGGML